MSDSLSIGIEILKAEHRASACILLLTCENQRLNFWDKQIFVKILNRKVSLADFQITCRYGFCMGGQVVLEMQHFRPRVSVVKWLPYNFNFRCTTSRIF